MKFRAFLIINLLLASTMGFADQINFSRKTINELYNESQERNGETIDESSLEEDKTNHRQLKYEAAKKSYITYSKYRNDQPLMYIYPTPQKKAALLIHSFTHEAFEMNAIASTLYSRGYNVIAIQLEGHDGTSVSMFDVKMDDWIRDANYGLDIAKNMGAEVLVVGYSLGGLLATTLAINRPTEVNGLAAISPALRIKVFGSSLICPLKKVFLSKLGQTIKRAVIKVALGYESKEGDS